MTLVLPRVAAWLFRTKTAKCLTVCPWEINDVGWKKNGNRRHSFNPLSTLYQPPEAMTELFIPADEALLDWKRRFKNPPERHSILKNNSFKKTD